MSGLSIQAVALADLEVKKQRVYVRDKNGRFATINSLVRMADGSTARITDSRSNGRLKVRRADGSTETVRGRDVEVTRGPTAGRDTVGGRAPTGAPPRVSREPAGSVGLVATSLPARQRPQRRTRYDQYVDDTVLTTAQSFREGDVVRVEGSGTGATPFDVYEVTDRAGERVTLRDAETGMEQVVRNPVGTRLKKRNRLLDRRKPSVADRVTRPTAADEEWDREDARAQRAAAEGRTAPLLNDDAIARQVADMSPAQRQRVLDRSYGSAASDEDVALGRAVEAAAAARQQPAFDADGNPRPMSDLTDAELAQVVAGTTWGDPGDEYAESAQMEMARRRRDRLNTPFTPAELDNIEASADAQDYGDDPDVESVAGVRAAIARERAGTATPADRSALVLQERTATNNPPTAAQVRAVRMRNTSDADLAQTDAEAPTPEPAADVLDDIRTRARELAKTEGIPPKRIERRLRAEAGLRPPLLTDEEYEAHRQDIETRLSAALKAKQSTDHIYSSDGGQTWAPERAALHKQIMDDLWERNSAVPNEGRGLIAGGLGGAGKSTTLRMDPNIDQSQYMTINPDDIKEEMAARGMIPVPEGLSPMEASALVHEESSFMAGELAKRAYAERRNVIWDITMSSRASVEKRIAAMRTAGYNDVEAVFVDIPIEQSVGRALGRHRDGLEARREGDGLGGRYVPPFIIRENASADWSSANRGVFEDLKGQFDRWSVYDSSGNNGPVLTQTSPSPRQPTLAERQAASGRGRTTPQPSTYQPWMGV